MAQITCNDNCEEKSVMKLKMSEGGEESFTNINKDIATLNNQMINHYIESKTEELTKIITDHVRKLDEDRINQIKAHNVALSKGKELKNVSALKEVKKIQVEPANQEFVDSLKSLLSYVTTFNQLLVESRKLDQDIRKRLESILMIVQKTLVEAVDKKNWIFKETDEVNAFISEYYNLLNYIRKKIVELNQVGCNVLCSSSGVKKEIKDNTSRLENKMFAFPLIFKLMPRMTQNITQNNSNKEIIEPDPLELNEKIIGKEIKSHLNVEFPELEPMVQVKVEEKIKYVENEKIITREAKKAPFVMAQEYFYGFGQSQNYKKAIEYYLQAEKEGILEASNCLGKMYIEGKGVQRNDLKAYEHFKISANAGNQDGLYYMGYMIENDLIKGFNSDNKLEEAIKYYKKAAAKNQTDALTDLAFIYENGIVGEPNYNKALQLYKNAIELNNARAMNNLASMYLKGVVNIMSKSQLEKEAFELYEKSADLGYVKGLTNLGICYLKGIGVPKDTVNAKKLFKEASLQKDPDAMFYIAYFKLKGASLNVNDEEYFEAADQLRYVIGADNSNSDAYYYLGYLYENGFGVDQDYKTASFYYSKAVLVSNDKNAKAMYKFANMLYAGKTGYTDTVRAYQLYTKAADLGDKDAIYVLGVLHDQGVSVEQNVEMAYKFFERGAKMGHADSKVQLAMMALKNKDKENEFNTMPENLLMGAIKQGNMNAIDVMSDNRNYKQPLFNTMPVKNKNYMNMTGELSNPNSGNTTQFVQLGEFLGKH